MTTHPTPHRSVPDANAPASHPALDAVEPLPAWVQALTTRASPHASRWRHVPAAVLTGTLAGAAALALNATTLTAAGLPWRGLALWGLPGAVALAGAAAALGVLTLVQALARAQDQLRDCRQTDRLTGLTRRHVFLKVAGDALQQARQQGDAISLVLVDIDRFKLVNDARGQDAGDLVLQETARRLRGLVDDPLQLARWSGEEFAVLLPGADDVAAAQHTDRLRAALRPPVALQPGEPAQWVTASFGIAAIHPPAQADLDTLLRMADDALYIAKHEGRDTVRIGRLG